MRSQRVFAPADSRGRSFSGRISIDSEPGGSANPDRLEFPGRETRCQHLEEIRTRGRVDAARVPAVPVDGPDPREGKRADERPRRAENPDFTDPAGASRQE